MLLLLLVDTNIEMKLKEFLERMSQSNKPIGKCIHHIRRKVKYCPDCLCYLCQQCIVNHSFQCQTHCCLLENYVNITCSLHQSRYNEYCSQCNINLCLVCKPDHFNHKTFSICSIDTLPFKERIDNLTDCIKKKQDVFYENEVSLEVNEDLIRFYLSLSYTAFTLKDYPCFQITCLLKTLSPKGEQKGRHGGELFLKDNKNSFTLEVNDDVIEIGE